MSPTCSGPWCPSSNVPDSGCCPPVTDCWPSTRSTATVPMSACSMCSCPVPTVDRCSGVCGTVLDVLMPGADGRQVLRRLRQEENWVPVLLLTQVGEGVERAMALEEGADDYLNKPFDPHELVARIRAVLRRTRNDGPPLATAPVPVSSFGLRVDRVGRRAWLGQRELVITPKGLTLLEYLMVHKDELIERSRLLEVLWGFEEAVGTRAVDSRVAELRRVLGEDAAEPRWIATVQGRGYRFVGEVRGEDGQRRI